MVTATDEHILVESIGLDEVTVDKEQWVIRGVKLAGRHSRRMRGPRKLSYSDEVITKTATLFENCPVTVRGGHDRAKRDWHCQNGQLRNGRTENLGTDKACSRFDWYLNPQDPLSAKICYDAEHFPQNIPLSQELTEWDQTLSEEGNILVTDISDDTTKIGVAAVYRGGLNDSLFESLEDQTVEIKTKEELLAHYGPLCEELCQCAQQQANTEMDSLKTKLEAAIAERETANGKVADLEAQLAKYHQAEEKAARTEQLLADVKEICGEEYHPSETLVEDCLILWEDARYKRTLQEIAAARKIATGRPAPANGDGQDPTSSSGLAGKTSGPRNRVGVHNRL